MSFQTLYWRDGDKAGRMRWRQDRKNEVETRQEEWGGDKAGRMRWKQGRKNEKNSKAKHKDPEDPPQQAQSPLYLKHVSVICTAVSLRVLDDILCCLHWLYLCCHGNSDFLCSSFPSDNVNRRGRKEARKTQNFHEGLRSDPLNFSSFMLPLSAHTHTHTHTHTHAHAHTHTDTDTKTHTVCLASAFSGYFQI